MKPPLFRHGILRGLNATSLSNTSEGRFGRMFRTLPHAKFDENALAKLADEMCAEKDPPTPETDNPRDDEENTGISAGYTYLGQFIDHDITFDPASFLQKENDPDSLEDFRTPRFDLDNVYGRGPDDQPYLYQSDGKKLLQGARALTGNGDPRSRDLARNQPDAGDVNAPKRAIIGDPRNDENVIVSQLQGILIRFHNRMVDLNPAMNFQEVQRLVRWHYQWVIVHDFLPTIIGQKTVDKILPKNGKPIHDNFKWNIRPYMPVEFSVAAYRFGHSMVRPIYRLNTTLPDRFDIFSMDPKTSLTGFREFPAEWAIDWKLFFDFGNKPDEFTKFRIQPAYKIDSSLVNPLKNLPPSIATQIPNLAHRNLLRGNSMGLPTGQDVAKALGIPVIPDDMLKVGKANAADKDTNKKLTDVDPSFAGKAPLWYYVLAEAQQQFKNDDTPIHMGPVGGQIIGEVFFGLMIGDSHSYLSQDANWQPDKSFLKDGEFGITELITVAQQA
jgi:Animal haem peroxidase